MNYSLFFSLHTSHSNTIYEIKVNFKTKNDCNVLSLSCWKNEEAINKNKLEEMNLGRRKRDDALHFERVQFVQTAGQPCSARHF